MHCTIGEGKGGEDKANEKETEKGGKVKEATEEQSETKADGDGEDEERGGRRRGEGTDKYTNCTVTCGVYKVNNHFIFKINII